MGRREWQVAKWQVAKISIQYCNVKLGLFAEEEAAAHAYDRAALYYRGA